MKINNICICSGYISLQILVGLGWVRIHNKAAVERQIEAKLYKITRTYSNSSDSYYCRNGCVYIKITTTQ